MAHRDSVVRQDFQDLGRLDSQVFPVQELRDFQDSAAYQGFLASQGFRAFQVFPESQGFLVLVLQSRYRMKARRLQPTYSHLILLGQVLLLLQ
ncbi:MAG: hypothetical protein EB072_18680 [Betaproteobacteria bacterium]|nr:hypothetical protein [Betaproteobacteria bacterium]